MSIRLSKNGVFEKEVRNRETDEYSYVPLESYWVSCNQTLEIEEGATFGHFWEAIWKLGGLDDTFLDAVGDRAHCPVREFMDEARQPFHDPDNDPSVVLEKLVLSKEFSAYKASRHMDKAHYSTHFNGMGYVKDENGTQKCGISFSFTPMFALTNLPLTIDPLIQVNIFDEKFDCTTNYYPASITLDEAIDAILWEISFHGGPAQRSETKKEIMGNYADIEEALKDPEKAIKEGKLISGDDLFGKLDSLVNEE